MFPDVLPSSRRPTPDARRSYRKAFTFGIDTIGLVRGQRTVSVDIGACDEFRRCAEFDHFHKKLSMGTLAPQTVIREA